MTQEEKTNAQLVVSVLRREGCCKSRDIAAKLTEATGRTITTSGVSSLLGRMSNPEACDLGYFIQKNRDGNALDYQLAEEARHLSEEQLYGLSLRIGRDRYPLDRALADYPALRRYIPEPDPAPATPDPPPRTERPRPALRVMRKLVGRMEPRKLIRFRKEAPEPVVDRSDRRMEVSFRYADDSAVCFNATLNTFILLCSVLVITVAICCFLIYLFFYPILVAGTVAAIIWGLVLLIWRFRKRRL